MSIINAGELKETLNIIYKHENGEQDSRGYPVLTFETIYKLRCKKKTVSTKEFINSDKQTSEIQLKFIVRKRDNIDNKKIVEYKNKFYDIKHVHEIDEFFLELTASDSGGVNLGLGI